MSEQKTTPTNASNGNLDAVFQAMVEDANTPLASISVLALRGGKVSYHKQFGNRFIDGANAANNKPANAQTLYRVASISKTITALGAMKLVEEGKLKLDTDVGEYLGYAFRNPAFPNTPITLRMLLAHTSSIRDDAGYYWEDKLGVDLKDVFTPGGKLYDKGQMWDQTREPGKFFAYANLPWGVIGTIMERVTNERFDRIIDRVLLTPMQVKGGFSPADMPKEDVANIATLYRKRSVVGGKEVWNPSGPWVAQVDDYSKQPPVSRAGASYRVGSNGTLFGPQGSIRLSAEGLSRIMLMLMNGGTIDGTRVLREDTVKLMMSPQWTYNGKSGADANGDTYKGLMLSWGLGLQIYTDATTTSLVGGKGAKEPGGRGDRLVEAGGFTGVGHFGDAWGLTSIMVFNPTTRDGVVFLVGGPGFNPETTPGKYSSMYRYEEQIIDALWRGAIKATANK
jgi:CubicO group peptidase (beta-lactamase class C family)